MVCTSGFFASGQSYNDFPDSIAIWNTVGNNVFTNAEYEFRFGLYADTVINSTSYSKVYRLTDTTLNNPQAVYFGAIREDENRRVYFLMPGFDESILYDFAAVPGDTIRYQTGGALCGDTFAFWPQTSHYLFVTSIDSIQLENNEYRKKLNLQGEIMTDQWVEGIGSISWFGLFNPIISDIALCGDSYSFACFRQNYETIYLNNVNCGTCYCNILLSLSDIFDNRDDQLSIFPNPSENEIKIEVVNGREDRYNVQVFNMSGQVIYPKTYMHGGFMKLCMQHIPAGQYILVVRDMDDRLVREGKLVIF